MGPQGGVHPIGLVMHPRRRTPPRAAAARNGSSSTPLTRRQRTKRSLENTPVTAAEVDEPVVRSYVQQVQGDICDQGVETTERSEHLRIAPVGARPRRSDMAGRRKHRSGL